MNETKKRVATIGVVCADLVVSGVDELPSAGKLAPANSARLGVGGPAAAAAIAAVRLGAAASFVGPVANDEIGKWLKYRLNKSGVDTMSMWTDPIAGLTSSASAVLVDKDGERRFVHAEGTNALLTAENFPYGALKGQDGLLWAGPGITTGLHGEGGAEILRRAKEKFGLKTAIDTVHPGTDKKLSALWMLKSALPYTDLLCISLSESLAFTGSSNPSEIAQCLFDGGAQIVLVKLGAEGIFLSWRVEGRIVGGTFSIRIPAFVIEAIDTTGSGDAAAMAAFLRLLHGDNLNDVASFANAVGAMVAECGQGAHGVPSVEQVRRFMEERERKPLD